MKIKDQREQMLKLHHQYNSHVMNCFLLLNESMGVLLFWLHAGEEKLIWILLCTLMICTS